MTHKGTIRITVPASVGNDLPKFRDALFQVGKHFGHPTCVSGHFCLFETERAFVLDDKLAVRSVAASPKIPDVVPTVTVTIPEKVNNSLELLQATVANVVKRIGCLPCTSGFDLAFQEEIGLSMSFTANAAGQIA